MKKTLIYLGVAALALTSCSGSKDDKIHEDSLKIAELTMEYNEATTFNDSLLLLMSDIYSGLDSINMQEGLLYNMGAGESLDRRAEVRRNLDNIKERLAANRSLLAQMESRLAASGNQNSVLSKTIEQMKARISQQETRISELEGQLASTTQELANANRKIDTLNVQVSETQEQLKVETEAKEIAEQTVVEVENQANTVYYAVGTSKELKANKILDQKFLRATKVLQGDFNENYFTRADKRTLKTIPTKSKKVKIRTNMPENSYRIDENADKTKTIVITNPNSFWSLSPYLVVEID